MSANDKEVFDGFVLVDKPKGITSFDVIRRLRKILKIRKMGHMGTLDPNATGLLPICLGRATRLSRFLLQAGKRYRASVRLGWATNTHDADGEPIGEPSEPPELSGEELEKILDRFRGVFLQRPPAFSAKKVGGKRLYEYAREGKEVTPEPCEVSISELTVRNYERHLIELDVTSSSGMYVRSLAHDIGQVIGCGAFLENLTRLAVGPLKLEQAYSLEEIEAKFGDGDRSFLRPMPDLLPNFPKVEINDAQMERIKNGTHITLLPMKVEDNQHIRLFDQRGNFVAVGLTKKPLGRAQTQVLPKVVLI